MNKYLAIGHFKENENITCVASEAYTIKDFRRELQANGYVPYVVLTAKSLSNILTLDSYSVFKRVTHMTSNYRRWHDIADYIIQCSDIMIERFANI